MAELTIDDIIMTPKEIQAFEKLKSDFLLRIDRSKTSGAKKALRSREIKGYSLIFDDEKLPLSVLLCDDEPLAEYSIQGCSMHLWLIRIFWIHFFVEGYDISEIENNKWNSWFWDLNDFANEWLTEPRYYYGLAVIYSKYLEWLNLSKKPGRPNNEIALIAFYKGEKIPRGENPSKLYQLFKYYEFKPNRTGAVDSEIKNKNQIKLFENVISQLSGNAKIKAEKDLSELKKNITSYIYFERDLKDLRK